MFTLKFIKLFICILFLSKCRAKDYCSSEYCSNSKQHVLCKYRSKEPASHCIDYQRRITNENDRRAILDKINSRRNKVAAGEIRSLPSADGMIKLEWNKELEIAAQRWADQCVKHNVPDIKDSCRDLGEMYVEQNIATIHGDAPGLSVLALVDVWFMELLNINTSVITRYLPSPEKGYSHYDYFTQLVWDQSRQVGCGGVEFKELLEDETVVKYRTIYRLVCNFAPGGNRRNKTVYTTGVPCSRCPIDSVCDPVYKGLCSQKHVNRLSDKEEDNAIIKPGVTKSMNEYTPRNMDSHILDAATEDISYLTETNTMPTEPDSDETYTTFDYFSHLYEFTRQMLTMRTLKTNTCKDVMAVDNFIELLKQKLSNDPMIKDLLATNKTSGIDVNTDGPFKDNGVAAFVDRIYSKKEASTTMKTAETGYVNSTLLVDLIEAVIFRHGGDKIQSTDDYRLNTQPMTAVKPVMIQAELGEIRQNQDFTGHYFFPEEEDEEPSSETTESYYDNTNIPISDIVLEIEDLKFSSVTKDFLEEILESETATENTDIDIIDINLKKVEQVRHRLQRSKRESFKIGDCDIQRNFYKRQISSCYGNLRDKFVVPYQQLLRKLASDLKKLKLYEIFDCARNNCYYSVHSFFIRVICILLVYSLSYILKF